MKVVMFALIVLGAGFMTSCKKCQTCTTEVSTNTVGVVTSTSTSTEYCGDDYDSAPVESSVTVDEAGVLVTTSIECTDS